MIVSLYPSAASPCSVRPLLLVYRKDDLGSALATYFTPLLKVNSSRTP